MKTLIIAFSIFIYSISFANVLSQNPTQGTQVVPGSSVNITISSDPLAVPGIVGLDQSEAQNAITGAGLTVGVITNNDPLKPPCKYYVSTSGLDTNDGLSSATPWQTMGKVNSFSFSPGSVVCFKNGDTWNASLNPTVSGTKEKRLIFQDYGVGGKWKIDGLGTLDRGVQIINKHYVTVSGFHVVNALNNGILVPHLTEASILSDFIVENTGGVGVTVRGENGLYLDGEVFGSADVGIGMGEPVNPGDMEGNVLDNIYSHHNGKNGITVEGDYTTIKNSEFAFNGQPACNTEGSGVAFLGTTGSILENSISHDNCGNGITLLAKGFWVNKDNIIRNNEFYNNVGPASPPFPASGIRCDTFTDRTQILYNKSYDNESAGIVYEDWCSNSLAEGNELYGNARGMTGSNKPGKGNVYRGNFVHDNVDGADFPTSNVEIILEKNTIWGNTQYGVNCQNNMLIVLVGNFIGNSGGTDIINCQ